MGTRVLQAFTSPAAVFPLAPCHVHGHLPALRPWFRVWIPPLLGTLSSGSGLPAWPCAHISLRWHPWAPEQPLGDLLQQRPAIQGRREGAGRLSSLPPGYQRSFCSRQASEHEQIVPPGAPLQPPLWLWP